MSLPISGLYVSPFLRHSNCFNVNDLDQSYCYDTSIRQFKSQAMYAFSLGRQDIITLWKCKEVTWSLTRLLSLGAAYHAYAIIVLVMVNLRTKFEAPIFTRLNDTKNNPKFSNMDGFGWLGHSKSSAVSLFDIVLWLSSFYSSAIFITIQSQINSKKRYRTYSCYNYDNVSPGLIDKTNVFSVVDETWGWSWDCFEVQDQQWQWTVSDCDKMWRPGDSMEVDDLSS